ncbi:hypothetical protein AT746_05830 [Lacimicrobium alkaliphilum]|uniref:Transposase n=1 Tax=Lacimicrobium alkaliphilum TaxID=1526571 RepID=A0A0U2PEY6_9ALTE|nr:hypothetical protein AT746_02340 [Lacimicrobium alkaliphilum]ALS97298.1 hypothetical protein AT746_02765 [Lacimicrobium alkaliphilum]ALS97514.1 hypothetical protein AT746_04000 [Lacimicrobium alkaliphilum]ALS97837.1 hypothetical protein AT746_05830 [Lacimicrobium alkaliphilum]
MKVLTKRHYSVDFKLSVVQKSISSPDTVKSLAKQLGIHPSMLSRWRTELTRPHASTETSVKNEGPEKSYQSLEKENRRLKKELERAKLEAEILKKAQSYFATKLK